MLCCLPGLDHESRNSILCGSAGETDIHYHHKSRHPIYQISFNDVWINIKVQIWIIWVIKWRGCKLFVDCARSWLESMTTWLTCGAWVSSCTLTALTLGIYWNHLILQSCHVLPLYAMFWPLEGMWCSVATHHSMASPTRKSSMRWAIASTPLNNQHGRHDETGWNQQKHSKFGWNPGSVHLVLQVRQGKVKFQAADWPLCWNAEHVYASGGKTAPVVVHVFENKHMHMLRHILGWGVLTFMLTCRTCICSVTSWVGGC